MTLSLGLALRGRSGPSDANGLTRTFLDAGAGGELPANPTALDFTGTATNDQIYLALVKNIGTQTNGITAVSLEGSAATLVGASSATVSRVKCYIYKIACPAAAANNASADVTVTGSGLYSVAAYKLSDTPTTETVASNQYTTNTSPMVGSVNTVEGGVVLGVGCFEDVSTGLTWAGATEDAAISFVDGSSTKFVEWVSEPIVSTETPRTITAAHTGATTSDHGAIITVALS